MTIGFFSAQFYMAGGIESVARSLKRILAEHGDRLVLFANQVDLKNLEGAICLPADDTREDVLVQQLKKTHLDCYALNHAVPVELVERDLKVLRKLGIPTVLMLHTAFPAPMLFDGEEGTYNHYLRLLRQCDAIGAVSRVDVVWWRGQGFRAFYTMNAFARPSIAIKKHSRAGACELLWLGRQAKLKQPDMALHVLTQVVREVPEAHLTMAGGSLDDWKPCRKLAVQLGLEKNVTFLAAVQGETLENLWRKASLNLLTSVSESFCLVIAEAKARHVPTAMFEIPFLDLVATGKGLITAPQDDVVALGSKIAAALKDREALQKLSDEAYESLSPFTEDAVYQSWKSLVENLRDPGTGREVDSNAAIIAQQMCFGWNRYCEQNLWAVQMTRDIAKLTGGLVTMRRLAIALRGCVKGVQKIKAVLCGK